MRILWFSVTPSLFNPRRNGHNGGGWVASLESIIHEVPDIELGVAFKFSDSHFRYEKEKTIYYPITKGRFGTYKSIIDDFKPDLIQIFGSENDFGTICGEIDIPIVIHIQGCLPPYHNALFPVGMSPIDFIRHKGLGLRQRYVGLRSEAVFRKQAKREIKTIQHCSYFMGRTEWDKGLIDLFNPKAKYFHCEEALRDSFLQGKRHWSWRDDKKKTFISVISRPWYKGCDLILKTANLLHRFTDLDFEWQVYGIPEMCFYESKYGIKANQVNVKAMGTASSEKLVEALCNSSCYVHPSYIDNSPNSVCEAQILGVPVLATHVGGMSSIVHDGDTGLLFPANAPYTLASLLKRVVNDKELAEGLGHRARQMAQKRHSPQIIRDSIVNIYKEIISK